MSLTLDENHVYRLDGQVLPGVTQILGDLGIADYSFLAHDVREKALERGRIVHRLTELDDLGKLDPASVDPALQGYLDAWRRFVRDHQLEWLAVEEMRHHPTYLYAGKPDRIAYSRKDVKSAGEGIVEVPLGQLIVIDLKTNQVPKWTALQTAAYSMMCVEGLPRRMGVALREDGSYIAETFTRADLLRQKQEWLSCVTAWRCRERYGN